MSNYEAPMRDMKCCIRNTPCVLLPPTTNGCLVCIIRKISVDDPYVILYVKAVLHCTVLCSVLLYCMLLYFTGRHCIILYSSVPKPSNNTFNLRNIPYQGTNSILEASMPQLRGLESLVRFCFEGLYASIKGC